MVSINGGSIPYKEIFFCPAFLDGNKLLFRVSQASVDPNLPYIFKIINYLTGEEIKSFEVDKILGLEKKKYMDQVYDGDFRQNNNYSIYFHYFGGMFFVFSNDKKEFVSKTITIDKTPMPKALLKDFGGGIRAIVREPADQFFFDGFVDNNNDFYLLNNISDKKNERVIDVYTTDDNGKYSYNHSIRLPYLDDGQRAFRIYKINNVLIVYYDDQTIISYSIV